MRRGYPDSGESTKLMIYYKKELSYKKDEAFQCAGCRSIFNSYADYLWHIRFCND